MAVALPLQRNLQFSETELARRIVGGDTAAFVQLMRRYNRMLFRTARAILHDDAEAEDALQDAYLRIYRSIAGFRGASKLSTWLVRVVVNEALGRWRKGARRPEAASAEIENCMASNDGPEPLAERSEMRRRLEAKIDALPMVLRSVFVLRALEELTVEETAEALGIPQATVRTRFFRARSRLRKALSREIDVAFDDAFAFAGERCDRIVAALMARLAARAGPGRDSRSFA